MAVIAVAAPAVAPEAGLGPVADAAAPAAPVLSPVADAGQVRVGGFWIDRYEYPNLPGQLPRVDVSWEEASALCTARGRRLCTETEWELAARGPDDHVYGYADEFDPGRCNTPVVENGAWIRDRGTAPSGAYALCTNEFGVHDMIGNVWEWTAGWYDPERGWRVVRGGSWFNSVNFARADGRYGHHLAASYRLDLIGFRCCRTAGE